MKLKTKFLLILCFLAIGIGFVTYIVSVINARTLTRQQAQGYTAEIKKKFDNLTQQNISMLSLGASFFVANQEIKDAFIARDRDKLHQITTPLFEQSRDLYGMTHLNFILPDNTAFLRMQDPETFGDPIQRHVLIDAIASQKTSSSIELGKNAFALRIATPYRNDTEIVGYVEMAREISNFLGSLSQDTQDILAIYGKKDLLDHDDYLASIQRKNALDTWNDMPHDVLLTFESQPIIHACLQKRDLSGFTSDENAYTEISYDGRTFFCTGFPIKDAEGHHIATLLAAHDISAIIATHQKVFSLELMTIIIIFGVCMCIFYFMLHRFVIMPTQVLSQAASAVASGDLTKRVSYISKDEIGELTKFFNIMVTRLATFQEKLTKESQRLQRNVKEITQKNQELDESHHATMRALDQVKAAKTLSDSLAHDLEKFKLAADSTSDFVVITDKNGSIVYANTAAEKISGLSFNELSRDVNAIDLFWGDHTDEKQYHMIMQSIERQRPFSCTVRNTTKNEQSYYAKVSITPILDERNDTIFVVSIGKDITAEKEMDIAKDNFVSLISHQLRTPLTSIKWLIELLLDPKTGKLSKKQKQFLHATYDSAHRLSLLISDILSINRMEMGRVRVVAVTTDIKKFFTDIISEVSDTSENKSINISLHLPHKPSKIHIDPILIRQVIINILSNAIKYTPENGTITCNVSIMDTYMKVVVTDSGIGIPQQDQVRIFERFFRASNAHAKFPDGTGLGLFIAKTIVEMCHGTIGFQSKLHHGTTVWFTLPIQDTKKHS